MSQLPADCLDEIFEYLEKDKITLRSCLLVNRLCCEVAVRILWRNIWNYSTLNFRTLISCLPNESKEILHENGIIISTQNLKPPMFNYPEFCKVLSINRINYKVAQLLKHRNSISSQIIGNFGSNINIVVQEICKLFMKQISSLKTLTFFGILNKPFCNYPGAKDCLRNLSELHCNSDTYPEFFYQLSQISHNIQILIITFSTAISSGLIDLISVQKNLKCLDLVQDDYCEDFKDIITSLAKIPNTDNLIKFKIYSGGLGHMPLSFITNFTNLRELALTFYYNNSFEDFKTLQDVTFTKLQILEFRYFFPEYEVFSKFLKNNGKNLRELYIGDDSSICDNSLNLSIAKFCPNLSKLSTGFKNDELETLKLIFNDCQRLKSIKIWCGGYFLSERVALEMIVKYSQNIDELIFCYLENILTDLLPEELESFLIDWTNRLPQKSISLFIANSARNSFNKNDENMKLIKKYINLGIIKKFKKRF